MIKPVCAGFGFVTSRADEITETGDIPEQILIRLRDADLVIADVSGGNPNVMYELGIRHAAGRPSIQVGEEGRLPFDVSTIRTILFSRTPRGLQHAGDELTASVRSLLADGTEPPKAARILWRTEGRSHVRGGSLHPARKPTIHELTLEVEVGWEDLNAVIRATGSILKGLAEKALTIGGAIESGRISHLYSSIRRASDDALKGLQIQAIRVDDAISRIDKSIQSLMAFHGTTKAGRSQLGAIATRAEKHARATSTLKPSIRALDRSYSRFPGDPAVVAPAREVVRMLLRNAQAYSDVSKWAREIRAFLERT